MENRNLSREQKILVVDDEPMIRALVGTILKSDGYGVCCAEGPEAAMAVFEQQPDFDLLLTDMVMPNMNGAALAGALLRIRPDLRVLYMSGFDPDLASPLSGLEFLRKPFLVPDLLEKVRGILH